MMTMVIYTEAHAISVLMNMYHSGHATEDLEAFIDNHFIYDENTDRVYLITEEGQEICEDPRLVSLVQMAHSMYTAEQINLLLSALS